MDLIQRRQAAVMNQHYQRYSLDYFLDCQQRLGIRQIELWCGASHFWLDHEGTGDVPALKQKLLDHDVRVVSVTAPSIAYQYQYASQEPELLEYSFRYFSNAIRLAAQLGADRVVVNSGWGYTGEDESTMWNRSSVPPVPCGGGGRHPSGNGIPAGRREQSGLRPAPCP